MNILKKKDSFAFASYISDSEQVNRAYILIKSIRENAGLYKDCLIYIGVDENLYKDCNKLKLANVTILELKIPDDVRDYFYAVKAYAAAEIGKNFNSSIKTLAWFDPETIVLGSVNDLELKPGFSAAIRPVFLMNKIGLLPDDSPNEFWGPVYSYLNLNFDNIPLVETEVDVIKTRAYYNCGIFSVNPSLGIMQKWAEIQTVFLNDSQYQKTACSTAQRKIFFHQMIFSCVVSSMLKSSEIASLPISCGYPLELNSRMPGEKKIKKLNNISCAITENIWEKNPNWYRDFEVDEPLKSWLEKISN